MDEYIVEINLKITIQMERVKGFFCWIIYTSLLEDVGGRMSGSFTPNFLNVNRVLWIRTPTNRTSRKNIWDQDVARRQLEGATRLRKERIPWNFEIPDYLLYLKIES